MHNYNQGDPWNDEAKDVGRVGLGRRSVGETFEGFRRAALLHLRPTGILGETLQRHERLRLLCHLFYNEQSSKNYCHTAPSRCRWTEKVQIK